MLARQKVSTSRVAIDRTKQDLPNTVKCIRTLAVFCLKKSIRINPDNWEAHCRIIIF